MNEICENRAEVSPVMSVQGIQKETERLLKEAINTRNNLAAELAQTNAHRDRIIGEMDYADQVIGTLQGIVPQVAPTVTASEMRIGEVANYSPYGYRGRG